MKFQRKCLKWQKTVGVVTCQICKIFGCSGCVVEKKEEKKEEDTKHLEERLRKKKEDVI